MNAESVRRKYKKSPIIEALCEIHFSESQTDSTLPGLLYEQIKDKYPLKEQISQNSFEIQFEQSGISSQKILQTPMMRFFNQDKSELIQVANNLLTVNRLIPYEDYESFVESIKTAIKKYVDVAQPKFVERIGLRYINHIFIPETLVNSDDYFAYLPRIREHYFNIQLSLELKSFHDNHASFITIATIPNKNQGVFLLDIYDNLKKNQQIDLENIEQDLNESHENVERIFENVITDKTRELFEEERTNG